MKACFLGAASRPTGTLDAALIFILRTFDRGADLVTHPETYVGQHIYTLCIFSSNGNAFKFIPLYINPFDYKQHKL